MGQRRRSGACLSPLTRPYVDALKVSPFDYAPLSVFTFQFKDSFHVLYLNGLMSYQARHMEAKGPTISGL